MTKEEFQSICKFIKSNFQYAQFLDDRDSMVLLFNSLNRFNYQVVKQASDEIVRDGQYDIQGKREMFTLESFVRAVEKKDREIRQRKQTLPAQDCQSCMGKKCKLGKCQMLYDKKGKDDHIPLCMCRGCGCVFVTDSDGNEYIKPTDCERGHHNFPWYFNPQTLAEIKHGV